ncbi:hypothetical protein CEXT_248731 [Caerostris extrusa]|uniref:THAP-type domain-containing protein n=1 Tax=Caerostris extrusa TaxID=172846 RepID=A0AAV4RWI1_CAEEX|nr:hypothetical protein CEXT_248731 [Caerostris extrusa]
MSLKFKTRIPSERRRRKKHFEIHLSCSTKYTQICKKHLAGFQNGLPQSRPFITDSVRGKIVCKPSRINALDNTKADNTSSKVERALDKRS